MRRRSQTEGQAGQGQRHQGDARGLRAGDSVAEHARRQGHAQHQPAGDEGLDQRQRGVRQGGDVQCPPPEPPGEAEQPRARGQQPAERGHGMARGHRRRGGRAAVLEQVADVQRHRRAEGKPEAEPQAGHPRNHRPAKASAVGVVSRHRRHECRPGNSA